jgi:predicted Zn-dependent protease
MGLASRRLDGDLRRLDGDEMGIGGAGAAFEWGLEMKPVNLDMPAFLAPQLDPSPVDAYRQAWQLLQERAPRRAIALLDPAIEAEPRSASLRTLRAWAYFQTAQLRRAEADLAGLVEQCPTDVWARFALGRVLERQSRYADALPHLRLAAVMSGDAEHEAGVLRVERRLAESDGSYDDLT